MLKFSRLSVFFAFLFSVNACTGQPSKIVNLSPSEFKNIILNGGILLDVRTSEEVAEGVIGNAINIDYYGDKFEQNVKSIPLETEIYVYCKRGGRSSSAAKILIEQGYTKVYNLDGGILAWKSEGLPLLDFDSSQD